MVPGSIPNMVLDSVNPVKACVRAEDFRDDYTVRSLVVLEERGHDTRESEGRTVERMGKDSLAVLVTVAQVKPVGLIRLEIGH